MIVGLHGRSRSGKDQSWKFIREWAEEQGRPARRDAFADRMKVGAVRALGVQGDFDSCLAMANEMKDGWQIVTVEPNGTQHPLTTREYYQCYGDEGVRQTFGQNFWIDLVIDAIQPDELLVITDVRYPNEAEAVRSRDGVVWHILRPGHGVDDNHDSEQPLSPALITRVIPNDRSLHHLRDLILSEVERLFS